MSSVEQPFLDEAVIRVTSGRGGDGCVAFRREKYVPRGGPDGGDGGRGGDVVLEADPNENTLLKIARKHHYKAQSGQPGRGANCHGKNGEDIVIRVPVGTLVKDSETGMVLRDLKQVGEQVIVARGGRGGRGNKAFATSINQTPRDCESGGNGEDKALQLELKLMADVGLVGLPNAGKSTLISMLSAARPKIASYPFTTLAPSLGIVELKPEQFVVMADIPGLIEGASEGVGLGFQFLRHVERCRVLLHLVDILPPDETDPAKAYKTIRKELEQYSPALAAKPEILVANKIDQIEDRAPVDVLSKALGKPVLALSGVTGEGKAALFEAIQSALRDLAESEAEGLL